jgi:hypothetical protein
MATVDTSDRKRLWLLLGAALLLLIALVVVWSYSHPFGPPEPVQAPAPVATTSFDLPGSLSMARSNCEGQARLAQKAIRQGDVSPDEARQGARLYAQAQGSVADLVAALRVELAGSATEKDRANTETQLAATIANLAAFADWNTQAKVPRYFDGDALSDAPAALAAFRSQIQTRAQSDLESTTSVLTAAQLPDWSTLGN